MDIIYILIGLVFGSALMFFFMNAKSTKKDESWQKKLSEIEKSNSQNVAQLDKEKSILAEKTNDLRLAIEQSAEELNLERQKNEELNTRIAKAEVEFKNLREKLTSQKEEMEELQKIFTLEFENVANKILKQNTREFSEASQKNMTDILNPLKEKITTFEKKVEDTYQKGIKDQTDLKAELKKLYDLNARISEEANNLTKALKSDSKKQGNWGEVILERVLERSGLVKGQEYETQVRATNEDGKSIQPDVVVNLPDNKHIIIDSKVSLVAYDHFSSEEEQEAKESFLKQHIESIKNHIKSLSDKNYHAAGLFDTPDFVLLFMPIESAFSLAIQADINLFNYAWERKIVLVSPTTLLATLRTVASIWKHEKQTRNAIEIARQGGALYDKFVGFLKNMEELGLQLGRATKTYEEASNKLSEGRGNLVRQVQNLKELGAKTNKSIPGNLLEKSN
ncbi:MAG: DNA recombination protein RmuC [Bacteroidales bacterium]|nr:DNA recombination protein RmuC [Bacteroidales bacterium]